MNMLASNYQQVVNELKERIKQARLKASWAVNKEMLLVYWEIGNTILEQQELEGWGAKIIDKLAIDLLLEFPDFKGLSVRNLKYMRAFAEAYPDFSHSSIVQQNAAQLQNTEIQPVAFVQQAVAQLPWGHHVVILDRVKDLQQRLFYIQKCIENKWSRSILIEQIGSVLFLRQGNAITNFKSTLPDIHSDLAQQTLKNPYVFDFLSLGEEMQERDLERALIHHLKKFMLELGRGYAYIGNQKNINVCGDDYFLDLLFYNYQLHCFVVFELKIGDFKPEFAGKLNFYVNTINEQLKGLNDNPTIGVLLCKTPNETVVKYSLQGIETPLGVSEYILQSALPSKLKGEIPSIEELEKEIDKEYEELKSPSQKRFEQLKEKLSNLKGNEIKQLADTKTLLEIVDKSLVPLYNALLIGMEDFKEMFVSIGYSWDGPNGEIVDIYNLQTLWKDEVFLKSRTEFRFYYNLYGFKKAGTEAFNSGYFITLIISTFWWGFSLMNYNNQQPFYKKLYHEQLDKTDIEQIVEIVYNKVIDDIEVQLTFMRNKNS